MSVRGVWVIKPLPETTPRPEGTVVFSRRFPTVEQRAKRSCDSCPDLYTPISSDSDICEEVMLHCSLPTEKYFEERDSISIPFHWPVYELFGGKLWPVVCLQKNGLMFMAIVSFVPEEGKRPLLIKIPGIPAAISLLQGMMEVLTKSDITQSSPQIAELYQYICLAAPFGSPNETNPANLKLQMQFRKAFAMPKEKTPSWRPAVYKGQSKLQLHIKEEIRAVQYDRVEVEDIWQVYGSLLCKAELEGHPDILISLTTPPGSTHLDHLTVHPCVQTADTEPFVSASHSTGDSPHTRNIRFSAPLDVFTLCHYQMSPSFLPIRGFYQMKSDDKSVELLVQLKLHESVRNNFEYLEVHLPFFNRNPIEKIDNVSPTTANIYIGSNKRKVIWNVGQRFPSKALETSVGATVIFTEFPPEDESEQTNDQSLEKKFCVDQNAFCELYFKIVDYTLTGCYIDPRSVTLFPSIKYKLNIVRELISSGYRIWNSHGDTLGMPSLSDITTSPSPFFAS